MLRKMMYRKIIVSSSLLLVILMMYLIPSNKNEVDIKNQTLEYIYPNDLEVIYLLDEHDYLSRTKISANNKDVILKSKDLIEGLIIDGKKKDIITKINDLKTPVGIRNVNYVVTSELIYEKLDPWLEPNKYLLVPDNMKSVYKDSNFTLYIDNYENGKYRFTNYYA